MTTKTARAADRLQPAAASLASTYVHLRDDDSASAVEQTGSFWQELIGGQRPELNAGRLVTCFAFGEDWSSWERHPAGEELVVLLSGTADLVLELADGEHTHALRVPGEFVLVPRATWHTARVSGPCSMLFVTPGLGTEHRPV